MNNEKQNFFTHPSKGHITGFSVFWAIGVLLSILSMTDLFSESPFQSKYFMMHFLVIGSTVTYGILLRNYLLSKDEE